MMVAVTATQDSTGDVGGELAGVEVEVADSDGVEDSIGDNSNSSSGVDECEVGFGYAGRIMTG